MKKAAVIMGSDSDFPVMSAALVTFKELGIPFEAHVFSAHRSPNETARFAEEAAGNGFGVFVAGAGMSAALAGTLAAHTILPVIGVPLSSKVLDGMDALLATAMMPPGIPVATVGVDGAKNAALLAAQILALQDEELSAKLMDMKKSMKEGVLKKDAALAKKVEEL